MKIKDNNKAGNNKCGFTLVELLMTMVISTFITAALYSAYKVQQKHATAQEQVTDMQQSIRVGMNMVVSELRNAGFDPTGKAKAGITEIAGNAIIFTSDFNENGFTNKDCDNGENIGYELHADADGVAVLGRYSRNSLPTLNEDNTIDTSNTLVENIEQIEFLYLDEAGVSTATLKEIRSIQVSMLAKARYPDQSFTNTMTYQAASGAVWDPPDDNFRRRLLITTVRIRNAGLVSK